MKIIVCLLSIISLVVGAGFVSGKEIYAFYSRFGCWSFLSIGFSFLLFWFLFNFLLNFSKNNEKTPQNTHFSSIISLIITLIFSSAMFAGVNKIIIFENKIVSFLLFTVVIFLCFMIFKNGLGTLKKLNFILLPIIIISLIVIFSNLYQKDVFVIKNNFDWVSLIYGFFYCVLNIANGSFVLINLGLTLTQKQKARVSFLSALVLALLLFLVNLILLQNPQSLSSDMPILFLCSGQWGSFMSLVVLLGALTSLLSLIYTSSSMMRGLCKNEILTFLISVILPCLASLFGFSLIITYLYPVASALAIFLMGELIVEKYKRT